MNFWENITGWYGNREKKATLNRSDSVESLDRKQEIEHKENNIKKPDDICCACCCCCLDISNIKNIKQAKIKDKHFYFCNEECYLEWLRIPVNMWFGFNYSRSLE